MNEPKPIRKLYEIAYMVDGTVLTDTVEADKINVYGGSNSIQFLDAVKIPYVNDPDPWNIEPVDDFTQTAVAGTDSYYWDYQPSSVFFNVIKVKTKGAVDEGSS